MSRRNISKTKQVIVDHKYGEQLIARFINFIMYDGKKSIAEGIVYGALETAGEKLKKSPTEVFFEVLDNVKPNVEVKSRRIGGATYQVPVEVRESRSVVLAMRWIVNTARKRNERLMKERLVGEFIDAVNKRGASVKKREDTHKMAEANKAFAHYRW